MCCGTIKDYKKQGIMSHVTLALAELIKRFLMHILPKGFVKIRFIVFKQPLKKDEINCFPKAPT